MITGGAGLIGREFCSLVAENGGIAVVADINLKEAQKVVDNICSKYPDAAFAAELNITVKNSIQTLLVTLKEKYGEISAVVNNAYPRNKNYGRKLEDVEYSDFCENVGLHLGGYFLVAQQFGLFFKKQGHGNIVNMASIYGVIAPRFEIYEDVSFTMPVEYAAIKSGVVHLTRYLAQYLKKSGVRVNCLSPGGVLDNQPEPFLRAYNEYCGTKGMLDTKDLNGALAFLLSDESRYINGQNLIVDDGFTL